MNDYGNAWTELSQDPFEARSCKIKGCQYSALGVSVKGPCYFTFDWKVSSEINADKLYLFVDGSDRKCISGTGSGWQTITIPLGYDSDYGDGDVAHVITWVYNKDAYGDAGEDCGWVRNFSCSSLPPGHTVHAFEAESEKIGDGQSSTISETFSGAGTLSFKWKVSSEANCDWFTFYVDGVKYDAISGESGEQVKIVLLKNGNMCASLSRLSGNFGSVLLSSEYGAAAADSDYSKYVGTHEVSTADGMNVVVRVANNGKASYKATDAEGKSVSGTSQLLLNADKDGFAQLWMVKNTRNVSYSYVVTLK